MLFVLLEGDYLMIFFCNTLPRGIVFTYCQYCYDVSFYFMGIMWSFFLNEPARCFHYAAMLSGPMAAARDVTSQFRLRNPVMLNTCRYGESCDNQLL